MLARMHCDARACGREERDHRREEWRDHLALLPKWLKSLGCDINMLAIVALFFKPLSLY